MLRQSHVSRRHQQGHDARLRHLLIEATHLQKYAGYLSQVMEKYDPSSSIGLAVFMRSKDCHEDVFEGALDDEK